MPETIALRLAAVQERIERAADRSGRASREVTLVAVTKTHPPEVVAKALAAGATDVGENRVQEAAEKIPALAAAGHRPRWHLIGHLQRNKARPAAELFDLMHSIDSARLAEALARHVAPGHRLPILLQVNVSGEATKEGFALPGGVTNQPGFDALLPEIEAILSLPALEVRGLMTIAPIVTSSEAARPTFAALRQLRDELARRYPATNWHELSMGMTDDFETAIAEGATIVRVGRAIFGERSAPSEPS